MIDPIHSLAFAIQANRGVYALLLGSGISRAAKIPTGWEITLDLVRKVAVLHKEACEPDPESWYRDRFGREPDYSELLDDLAKTPSERQQLLRGYWEPNEQEREEGLKQPTEAHRAIAALAADGFIRVIVTTNFDRLLERALGDVGVVPTVLSSPNDVKGAIPLIHTECCLFKVHGDYVDTRIRNTPGELACYPPEFDTLLDRIFDEFGVIVCGWSGEWDAAMRSAIVRAPSRRFSTYWALYEKEGARARKSDRPSQSTNDSDQKCGLVFLHRSAMCEVNRRILDVSPVVDGSGGGEFEAVCFRTTVPDSTCRPHRCDSRSDHREKHRRGVLG